MNLVRRMCGAWLLCCLCAARIQADVLIFQETFDNTGGRDTNVSAVGWAAHGGAGAAWYDLPGQNVAISSNRGDTAIGTPFGYLSAWWGGSSNDQRTLFWTEDVAALGLAVEDISRVEWTQGNATVDMRDRVAIRVDGAWYVSPLAPAQINATTGGNFWQNATPISFDWGDYLVNAWVPLNFDGLLNGAGTTLAMSAGSPVNLPDGALQAIGLYVENSATGTRRMDSFAIYAAPEPGTLGLALCGAALLAWRRRARLTAQV